MGTVNSVELLSSSPSFTKERVQRELSETGWNYQTLAARTIPEYPSVEAQAFHAVFGVIAEVQEAYDVWDYYQTRRWAPEGDTDQEELNEMVRHFYRELGDICWMCAEMYSAYGIDMQDDYPWIFSNAASIHANWRYHSPAIGIGDIFDMLRRRAAALAADYQHLYQGRPIDTEREKAAADYARRSGVSGSIHYGVAGAGRYYSARGNGCCAADKYRQAAQEISRCGLGA